MRIPDMGHIVTNPQTILDFFKNGGWLVYKRREGKCYLYTSIISPEVEIDRDLFYILDYHTYITQDSGNFDFQESYYRYDRDFELKQKVGIELFLECIKNTCNELKPKYKQLIRQHKLERLCH